MLLKWNKDGLKVLHFIIGKSTKLSREYATLLPGVNEITDAEYENCKDSVQDCIKDGSLEELNIKTQTGPGKPQKIASTLTEVPSSKAEKLIADTVSGETLNLWLSRENRDAVRVMIRRKLEALKIKEVYVPLKDEPFEVEEDEKVKEPVRV